MGIGSCSVRAVQIDPKKSIRPKKYRPLVSSFVAGSSSGPAIDLGGSGVDLSDGICPGVGGVRQDLEQERSKTGLRHSAQTVCPLG